MDIYQDRIRPLFESSGKGDAELERLIGIPPKTINKWKYGVVKSYMKYIAQIAKYFNVDTDYLLGNTDDPRPAGQGKTPAPESVRELSDSDLKVAYFRGADPTLTEEDMDAMWQDAKNFRDFIVERRKKEKNGGQSN